MLAWGVGGTKPFGPGSIASIDTFGREFITYSYLCAHPPIIIKGGSWLGFLWLEARTGIGEFLLTERVERRPGQPGSALPDPDQFGFVGSGTQS